MDTQIKSMSEVDWARGVGYSILASIVGGASKLAIRKSWLIERSIAAQHDEVDSTVETETDVKSVSSTRLGHCPGSVTQRIASLTDNNKGNRQDNDTSIDYEIHYSASSSSDSSGLQSRSQSDNKIKRTKRIALGLRLSGMVGMTFLNPLFCVLAMNYASPSILAPFSGLTLVWIVLFAEMIIGERPNSIQVLAASLIVVGEVIVAIWGDHTNDEGVSIDEVIISYENGYFQSYFVFITLWLLVIFYLILRKSPTPPSLRRFAWGVSGGSVTGLQNFLKDSLTIIKAVKADDDESLYPWCLYILICLGMLTSFGGLLCLTACMKRYDATFSSAMFVGSFVISASVMSAVHYNTFQNLESIWNWIMYPTGLIVLMLGVFILVRKTTETGIDDSDTHLSFTDKTPFISNLEEEEEKGNTRVVI